MNRKLPAIFTVVIFALTFNLHAQYALQVTHDTTICQGQSVQLNVSGGTTYTWTPSGTLSGSTTATPVATPTQTTTYVVTSQTASANIAVNGSFSAGNTGFTSQYHYEQLYDTLGPQDYTIGNTPNTWNSGYTNCGLHGTDVAEMIVDGSLTANVPVWCETFSVVPNTNYALSAYFESLDQSNFPKLQWMVNGTLAGSATGSFIECIWEHVTDTWNSGSNTTATFCLADNLSGPASGDDFALADITITGTQALTDSVKVIVIAPPVVNIGNDTSICSGNIVTLNATTPNSTYLWNTGATTATIAVNTAGTYTVLVNNGCKVKDSIVISTISPPAVINLGNDTTYCGNFSRVLATGNASTVWSTGTTAAQITATTPGTYYATETNQCGISSDTIVITQKAAPLVNLGNDTTLCSGQTLSLNASYASSTYLWNTGSTSPTITVDSAATYSVQVNNGCKASDTIKVMYAAAPALFSLGNDTAYCGNFSRVLTTGYANTMWNTGASGAQITVSSPGTYFATEANQCGNTSDTIILTQATAPVVSLGADTAICSAQTVVLDAGNAGASYSWSNNTNGETVTTSSPGSYAVTVTNMAGCSATASVNISGYNVPLSVTSSNTSCGLANGTARAVITNGRAPYHYFWNNNDTTSGISALGSGSYNVTVTDAGGCTASAIATVGASGANSVSVTASSNLICPNDTATLCANSGFVSYLWSNGDTAQCISTQSADTYFVTATDGGNCTATSSGNSIQVRTPPSVTVSVSGDTLTSYSASSYQWYLNDTLIPGATTGVYIAQVSGNYKVVISDVHGCTAASSAVAVIISGIGNILNGDNVKVYPNPLEDGNWMLQVSETMMGAGVELYDDNGRIVYRTKITTMLLPLDINTARGIYLLRLTTNDKYYTTRLIKL